MKTAISAIIAVGLVSGASAVAQNQATSPKAEENVSGVTGVRSAIGPDGTAVKGDPALATRKSSGVQSSGPATATGIVEIGSNPAPR
jgi:hypothetical protein